MSLPGIGSIGSAVGDLLGFATNPFGLPSAGVWNLSQAAFKTDGGREVIFWAEKDANPKSKTGLEQVTDSGGRRKVKYEYPYRDGQRVADLGRKGERFSLNVTFYGTDYQVALKDFLEIVVNSKESGTLTHPVRGDIRCGAFDWEFIHRHDQWNAVTIRVQFEEDNTDTLQGLNLKAGSPDSPLRSALGALLSAQKLIGAVISSVSAALLIPGAIKASMQARLDSIVGGATSLLAQLGITFGADAQTQSLLSQAAKVGGIGNLFSATESISTAAGTVESKVPPTFQVGFTASDQASINSESAAFAAANQITPQQAVFSANEIRKEITAALAEANEYFGNDGYEMVIQYRNITNQIQEAVESAISQATPNVTLYTVPRPMSLRMVAFMNGLDKDRQNDLESLNPYLESVNLISAGVQVMVPAA
jgi:hypothetical protein